MKNDFKEKLGFTLAEGATHVGMYHNIGKTLNGLVKSATHVENCHNTRRVAFTLAEGATHVDISDNYRKSAFTLAEVLITLGIIGIVAAMTIPTLVKNYQKKVTVIQLQKVYAVLNQIARMAVANDSIRGYTAGQTITEAKTKDFFNEFFFSQLKSPKVISYGSNVYKDCPPSQYCYKLLNGNGTTEASIFTDYSAGRVFFSTNENFLYFLNTMIWDVKYDEDGNIISQTARYNTNPKVTVDINGPSGPNTLGKDIFEFIVNFDKGNAYPYHNTATTVEINRNCSNSGRGDGCAEKIRRDGWQIKDDYPW